jgi:hypothetical protein
MYLARQGMDAFQYYYDIKVVDLNLLFRKIRKQQGGPISKSWLLKEATSITLVLQ